MQYHRQSYLFFTLGFILMFLLGWSQPALAESWGSRQGNIQGHRSGNHGWQNPARGQGSHSKGFLRTGAIAQHRSDRHVNINRSRVKDYNRGWDTRYHHNRYYPARGHYVRTLPHGYHTVYHRRAPYYFSSGVWYRPYGPYFTVVAPPFGLVIPVLPPFYSTLWVGGIPYYYANNTYYTYYPGGGYVVTNPPENKVSEEPPQADWLYSYPTQGQSEQQQADDRYTCHRWAVGQTGYDPTLPLGGVAESQSAQKRSDYQRALGACLEGRGYSVK